MPNDLNGIIESLQHRAMSGELEEQANRKRRRIRTNRFVDLYAKVYTPPNQKKKKKKTKKIASKTPDPLSSDSDEEPLQKLKSKHIRSSKKMGNKAMKRIESQEKNGFILQMKTVRVNPMMKAIKALAIVSEMRIILSFFMAVLLIRSYCMEDRSWKSQDWLQGTIKNKLHFQI